MTIELTFMTYSIGNLVLFVIQYQCDFWYLYILSYTFISFYTVIFYFPIFSSCTFPILYFFICCTLYILYLSYTIRVIDTLFLILVYLSYTFLYKAHIHIFFYYLVFVFVSYIMNASMHSCIHMFICIFIYSYPFISCLHHILYAFLS